MTLYLLFKCPLKLTEAYLGDDIDVERRLLIFKLSIKCMQNISYMYLANTELLCHHIKVVPRFSNSALKDLQTIGWLYDSDIKGSTNYFSGID